jgi:hypothetical protein
MPYLTSLCLYAIAGLGKGGSKWIQGIKPGKAVHLQVLKLTNSVHLYDQTTFKTKAIESPRRGEEQE